MGEIKVKELIDALKGKEEKGIERLGVLMENHNYYHFIRLVDGECIKIPLNQEVENEGRH